MKDRDSRYQAAKRWFKRGTAERDPFDAFFYLWIALVIAARCGAQREPEDADSGTVKEYFTLNRDRVLSALKEEDTVVVRLRKRRGTEGGKVVETYGSEPQRKRRRQEFDRFACSYDELTDSTKVHTIAEILIQVRNSLFHARKLYDDKQDRELLELVNPLMKSILKNIEGFDG